jgi:hypothetical protein
VNGAAPDHLIRGLENAGTIFFHLEGIPVLHITLANFTVRNLEIPCQPVDVVIVNEQE